MLGACPRSYPRELHRRTLVCSALALVGLGTDALAQSVVVPAANAAARGTGGLNTLTRNAANPRTYMLGLPATELAGIPVGSIINGLSFRASITASNAATWPPTDTSWVNYDISVGNAIALGTWTTTFATNFSGTPVKVRSGGMTIEAGTFTNNTALPAPQPNAWGDFYWDFQTPFTYTGGDLAILFSHDGSNQATSNLFLDTIASVAATGLGYSGTGYNVATGALTTFSIPRVHYGFGKACPGTGGKLPNLVQSNNVTGGGAVTFAIGNGPASAPAVYAFGSNQVNIPLPNGCTLYTPPLATLGTTLSALGRAKFSATLPAGIAATVYVQSVLLDAGATGGYTASNAVTLTVKP